MALSARSAGSAHRPGRRRSRCSRSGRPGRGRAGACQRDGGSETLAAAAGAEPGSSRINTLGSRRATWTSSSLAATARARSRTMPLMGTTKRGGEPTSAKTDNGTICSAICGPAELSGRAQDLLPPAPQHGVKRARATGADPWRASAADHLMAASQRIESRGACVAA